MRWDLFCRVIDNHGDLGVCWRLACDLAARGDEVRLWSTMPRAGLDGPATARPGVQVLPWTEQGPDTVADAVVEAFGCDPPADFVRPHGRAPPPVWINLEYLSAESLRRTLARPAIAAAGAA
jgi:uncharacterized repeat protein (TIGR03837 family)